MVRLAPILLVVLLAGCASAPAPDTTPTPDDVYALEVGGALLHNGGVKGALSVLHVAEGDDVKVAFPSGVLVLDADGRLAPATEPVTINEGSLVQYLPPYGAASVAVDITAGGVTDMVELALDDGRALVDGTLPVELMKFQRDNFPHRTPGMENYRKSVTYFEEYFASLGYEVETFESPLPVDLPVGGVTTESIVSVLGTKRGTLTPERYIVMGGHFDVVPDTTEGAFDNTGGTMATLAMAQVFSRVNTSHTLVFAAWGGEEDGILGSQAWVTGHPELVPFIDLYVNFDVTGLAWPAPLPDPAPIVASTGPDGPVGDALAAQHATIVEEWMDVGAEWVYEPIAQGQAAGAGVNAQSDHTPFMARGIPVLFQFTARLDDAFLFIHQETDTVENLTRYAYRGPDGLDSELNATERTEAEAALAKSFETQMVPAFYLTVLTDNGVMQPTRPASLPALVNARS